LRDASIGGLIGCFERHVDVPAVGEKEGGVREDVADGDRFDVGSRRVAGVVGVERERLAGQGRVVALTQFLPDGGMNTLRVAGAGGMRSIKRRW